MHRMNPHRINPMLQNTPSSTHYTWMQQALQQAKRGLYSTHPNPRVGCVIVKNGVVLGTGYHLQAGQPHAEIMALRAAQEEHGSSTIRGATLYVTLEPCYHQGRTPPCTQAIIQAGIQTVYLAAIDPNPAVTRKGMTALQQAGIAVHNGLLADETQQLNAGYWCRHQRKRPFTRLKLAISLDGRSSRIPHNTQQKNRWITGAAARKDVQHWRAMSSAIMTGINTVVTDNPQLNVRGLEGYANDKPWRQPDLFIIDNGYLSIAPDARIFAAKRRVFLVTQAKFLQKNANCLRTRTFPGQLELLEMPCQPDTRHTDLHPLGRYLAETGINELLVEAGRGLSSSCLRSGLVDQLIIYQAPVLLSDREHGVLTSGPGYGSSMDLKIIDTTQLGRDIRYIAEPQDAALQDISCLSNTVY